MEAEAVKIARGILLIARSRRHLVWQQLLSTEVVGGTISGERTAFSFLVDTSRNCW